VSRLFLLEKWLVMMIPSTFIFQLTRSKNDSPLSRRIYRDRGRSQAKKWLIGIADRWARPVRILIGTMKIADVDGQIGNVVQRNLLVSLHSVLDRCHICRSGL